MIHARFAGVTSSGLFDTQHQGRQPFYGGPKTNAAQEEKTYAKTNVRAPEALPTN